MGRGVAVVLFTDLVGSTELRSRLGEDAADELRRRHDQLLSQAVAANNGRVVKGLGDGIMATFAGATDAMAAAVAIQQAVDRLNRSGKAPAPVSVRVGLAAGDVGFEGDDVHGTPVIEAARLCAVAGNDEILAADVVRILAGATGGHDYVSVGPLELKGLDHAVVAVRVRWEPAAVSTVPMPTLLTDVGPIFVGRDAEVDRLRQLWKQAVAGERQVALLAGEPGVGKTRLAAELAIGVHEEGGIVLAGRCDEDLGVPYQPFVEALRHFMDHTPAEDLPERLGRYGGELARLVPELEDFPLPPPMRSDPQTEQYRLFDALAAWLHAVSAEEPVLFLLDDLQWAAKPTLLLLRHVVRSADTMRVLFLGTYRDTEVGHDHPLREVLVDLRRQRDIERVSLLGLDSSAVVAFLEQAADRNLDDDDILLARAVYEETEGNPFFVREVLRHLVETGGLERREGRWTVPLPVEEVGIPESVRDVVGRRLARLSPEANQALRVAAVAGAEFELSIVQAASGLTDDVLLCAVEEATQARLTVETAAPGRYRFAHALVRDTLYGELSAARRVVVHHRVAEGLETVHASDLGDYLPALAHHWARATAPVSDPTRAVDYATRAGDRARAQLAHDEAVSYYRQALELLGDRDNPRRLELVIALGESQRDAGDTGHRETLLEAARLAQARDDHSALASAALANGRGFLMSKLGQVDSDKIGVLEAALASVADGDRIRARLLGNLAMELMYSPDFERRASVSAEALRLARQADDPVTLAHVMIGRFQAVSAPHTVAERLALTAELVELAERIGDPALISRAWFVRYRVATEA
ncbi:MAG TPA: AAA family ATPase, partial [Acidimicrobiia bacterium]|nr:AAA family ATPase [Acidimicrobiia bacterium]